MVLAFGSLALVTAAAAMSVQPTRLGWMELRLPRVSDCGAVPPDGFKCMKRLLALCTRALDEDDVEGVLLTIEPGNAFSTGGDFSTLAEMSSYGPANARLYLQIESAVALQLHQNKCSL